MGHIKQTNMHFTGAPEREKGGKRVENLFGEKMVENFPNLVNEADIQTQETWRVPKKMNPKRPTPRHIIKS